MQEGFFAKTDPHIDTDRSNEILDSATPNAAVGTYLKAWIDIHFWVKLSAIKISLDILMATNRSPTRQQANLMQARKSDRDKSGCPRPHLPTSQRRKDHPPGKATVNSAGSAHLLRQGVTQISANRGTPADPSPPWYSCCGRCRGPCEGAVRQSLSAPKLWLLR